MSDKPDLLPHSNHISMEGLVSSNACHVSQPLWWQPGVCGAEEQAMRSLFFALAFVAVPLAEVAAKECTAEQYDADRTRMTAATDAGILRPDPDSGRDGITLSVYVSESFWERLTFVEKVDFTESLVCAWAGVGKGVLKLHLRSEMTGKVIGKWDINRLTVP
jgi:hypothetical protein